MGASGTEYTFGEEGAEFITPKDEIGDGGIFANINIRIDRVTSDVDLEKIKPIVERALLEIHSRRGMI